MKVDFLELDKLRDCKWKVSVNRGIRRMKIIRIFRVEVLELIVDEK